MKTESDMQMALKAAIENYRDAAKSGSKTSEANAMMTLITVAQGVLIVATTTPVVVDAAPVIGEVFGAEVNADEVMRMVEAITGMTPVHP